MENNFTNIGNFTNNTLDTLVNNNDKLNLTQEHQNFLSAKTLIAIIILLVHTIASPIFEKFQIQYIHESGISMLLGMIVGLVSMLVSPNVINYKYRI